MADNRSILQFSDVAGESARDRLCRMVRFANGWSLSNSRDKLSALVGRGVDAPDYAVEWKTNCGTSALGFLAFTCGTVDAAGAVHSLLSTPSRIGQAIAWLSQIGNDKGAWVTYSASGQQPRGGDLLWYWNHPTRTKDDGTTETVYDDHVEWALADPGSDHVADHGGGGRSNNAITVGNGDLGTNAGRALRKFLDLDKLGITPVATQSSSATDPGATDPGTNQGPVDLGTDAPDVDTGEQSMVTGGNDFGDPDPGTPPDNANA